MGLGNPGQEYRGTRHNIGFQFIDRLSESFNIQLRKRHFKKFLIGKGLHGNKSFFLVKPLTYVNRSGIILDNLLKYTDGNTRDLLVVCDNLDLNPGICRLKSDGSSTGQKGLSSVIENLRTTNFMRLYFGIGRPHLKEDIVDYVLNKFPADERMLVDKAIARAAESILGLLHMPVEKVMNVVNQKPTYC